MKLSKADCLNELLLIDPNIFKDPNLNWWGENVKTIRYSDTNEIRNFFDNLPISGSIGHFEERPIYVK